MVFFFVFFELGFGWGGLFVCLPSALRFFWGGVKCSLTKLMIFGLMRNSPWMPLPWLTKYQAATIHVEWQITYSSEFSPKPF
ncbi:MAG: hypothetical protein LBJ58_00940, partial [Tannerellaceae bacterium]|nr:hypothetical protein [Tannerellaceae bacterium]